VKAEYDSTADALSIDLTDDVHWDRAEVIDDDLCTVATVGGAPANIELLSPAEHIGLLQRAADRFGLDAQALEAAARSALAAPDRPVTVEVGSLLTG
jgi:hypothetical protein